jgi:hypothetical protein
VSEGNSWQEWKKFVLSKLDELQHHAEKQRIDANARNETILRELEKIRLEIHTIKIKSGVWGALAGSIPAILTAYIALKQG